MSIKNLSRLRRAKKTRMKIRHQSSPRLSVFRSSQHFYAQVFDSLGATVIASASTVECTATVFTFNSLQALIILKAISPLLAIKTFFITILFFN